MERTMMKVESFKTTTSWVSKKAKEEISSLSQDISTLSANLEDKAKLIFNKLRGKSRKPLGDLLKEHNLPSGLFPENITCYEFDKLKGKLIVYLPSACEVNFKDSSVIRYANRVKATLSRGKLQGIEGMKTKVLVWVKVSSVTIESYKSDKVWFTAGVKKARPKFAYETPCNAVQVGEF